MRTKVLLATAVWAGVALLWPAASYGGGPNMPVPNIVGQKFTNTTVGVGDPGANNPLGSGEIPSSTPAERFEFRMKQAQKLFDQQDYYDSLQEANLACVVMTDKSQHQRLAAFYTKVNEAGLVALDAGRQLLKQKKYVDAIKYLGLISRTFTPMPCRAARDELTRIKGDSEIQAALREVKPRPGGGADGHGVLGPAAAFQDADHHPGGGVGHDQAQKAR